MPLMDHLGELRRRLTIIVVSVLATTLVVYFATPTLIDVMMDAIRNAMPKGTELTVLTALGGFTIRFKVALFFGAIVCTPIIVWEIMGFILPALKEKEKRWVVPTVGVYAVTYAAGTVMHGWTAVAQGRSSIAKKGMHTAARTMAAITLELLRKPELREQVKKDFETVKNGRIYKTLIPDSMKPGMF